MYDDKYQVGAIIDSQWGWEQTNVDFYRIVKRTNATVWLEPLQSQAVENAESYLGRQSMTGYSVPSDTPKQIGAFEVAMASCRYDGKPIRRRLAYRDGKCIGLQIKHGWASLWDGDAVNWTDYA